ncbi:MAG TPA: ADOP family duplicated permease, partial [Gemmatimonadaceae bacterium]
ESALKDLRYAFRGLRAKPAFTLGVILTLGLGIGANAAMFSIVDSLLLRDPPFLRRAGLVHRIYEYTTRNNTERADRDLQIPRYLDYLRDTRSFSTIAAFATPHVAIGDGESARSFPVTAASASFFDLFDAHPALGRFFTAQDDQMPTGSPVVVLGYAYWQMAFGGRADVLGQKLRVGRTLCTIIGVAPAGFIGVAEESVPAVFLPITTHAWDLRGSDVRKGYDYTTNYAWHWFELLARRKPGVSVASANADLTAALNRSYISQIATEKGGRETLASLRPRATLEPIPVGRGPDAGPQAKVALWVSGVAVIVLLIACANVANLLLARAVARRREIALRLALGVSRARLIRQLLTETLLLALLGGAAGIGTAALGGRVLTALFLPPDLRSGVIGDRRTLLVALAASVVAALLTGIAPVSQAIRSDLAHVLAGGGRDAGAHRSPARTALLVFQATLSVVLLVGAGLFVRSLENVRALRLGFDVRPVVAITENLRGTPLTLAERIALEQRLTGEARATPGVVSATPAPSVPFWGFEGRYLFAPGIDSVERLGSFYLQAGNAEFFRTFGTRILRGRGFDDRDGAGSVRVVVVSERMANALWPGRDPIGKCIRISADTAPCTTVIGVAEEMRIRTLTERKDGLREFTYSVPISQFDDGAAGMLLVRVAGSAADYAETVRRRMQRIMPGASYLMAAPLSNMLDPKIESWHTGATMFVAFAGLALAITGVGLYSVIAYGVAMRRQEIGVRIALGASRAHVVRLVVRGGLRLVVAGIAAGG